MMPRLIPVCVLALTLTGCAGAAAPTTQTLAADSASDATAAATLAQDLRPLHAEAVELAAAVRAAATDADVTALAGRIEAGQQSLLDDVDAQLAATGAAPAELAALTAVELEALRSATGEQAVRLGLDGLLRNHLQAVARAKAAVADGRQGAEGELSRRVLDEQGATLQELSALG